MNSELPRLLITIGDVAGIGPEIIARGWPALQSVCRPIVVGDPDWMRWALRLASSSARVNEITGPDSAQPSSTSVPCLAGTAADLSKVVPGQVCAAAGQAAYDFLCTAIDYTLAGKADGIVTAPLHKEGLRAAGLHYPGHTEILAERTGTPHYGMMLFGHGMGVLHVTLHMALRDVFAHLSTDGVIEKIACWRSFCPLAVVARIGVAGLNPHASDGGPLWRRGTPPASSQQCGHACEALTSAALARRHAFLRAARGIHGVVAMYHDQGHIAPAARSVEPVNITVGLPIVRTSVAHGTAYDIAGKGADASS